MNFSGKVFKAVQYGVVPETGLIDYDQVQRLATEHKPRMIIAGFSAYSRFIDFARFRAIADSVGAYLVVDMAHVAGLIAAGLYPNPIPFADVTATTTHKTPLHRTTMAQITASPHRQHTSKMAWFNQSLPHEVMRWC